MSPLVRLQRLSLAAAGISVAAFFASLTVLLWQQPNLLLHVDGTLTRTEAVLSKARATLDNLDKGTKVWADSAKGQAAAIEDTATQARGTLYAAQETLTGLQTTSVKLNGTADALTGLLHAGTGTVTQAQADLVTLNDSLAATKPLIQHSDLAVQHFDALVSSKDLADALTNVQVTTQNIAGVTADARKAADKATEDYLSPKPWYRKIGRLAVDTYDYGALLARHIP